MMMTMMVVMKLPYFMRSNVMVTYSLSSEDILVVSSPMKTNRRPSSLKLYFWYMHISGPGEK